MSNRKYSQSPMLRAAIPLIVGMAASHFLPSFSAWLIVGVATLVLAFALRRQAVWQSLTITLAWFSLGGCLMSRSEEGMSVQLPPHDAEYEAVLTSEPTLHGKVIQADLLIMDGEQPFKAKASILRDTLTDRWKALQVGSGIRAKSQLTAPANFRDGTFDYALYLRRHGYRASTFIHWRNWTEAEVSLTSLSALDRTILAAKRLRHQFLSRFQSLGIDGQEYAVVAALTLGEKAYLSKETKNDYSVSGASHVLALSGLHLSILYGLLTFLMMGWRRQWMAQALIMTLIWAFVVLVGFALSVVRSATMLTIYSLVSLLQRDKFSLNTLALAAVVMLIVEPLNLYDTGFQMSFLAVLGILLFFPLFNAFVSKRFLQRHRLLAWVWSMVNTSFSAQLLIFPLVAYQFGRFSCYFLLANFIAIPGAIILLNGIVALVPLTLFPVLAAWWTKCLAIATWLMNSGLQLIASLPGASIEGLQWSVGQVITIYFLIACCYILLRLLFRYKIILPTT